MACIPEDADTLFTTIRDHYVMRLASLASTHEGYIEPAYRLADGSLARDGVLNLPCRTDFVTLNGEPLSVEVATQLHFTPMNYLVTSMAVSIMPFTWDWLPMQVHGLTLKQVGEIGREWFLACFDQDDENEPTPEGLYGVVHFLSDPEWVEGAPHLNLDLGSAPQAVLMDLLDLFAQAGAEQVGLGSVIAPFRKMPV